MERKDSILKKLTYGLSETYERIKKRQAREEEEVAIE
jgi:hypothetical protein